MPFVLERMQSGANSATYYMLGTPDELYQNYLKGPDWADLPNGRLKDLLNRTYLTVEGDANYVEFYRAFAAAGGSLTTVKYNDSSNDYASLTLDFAGLIAPIGTPLVRIETVDPGQPKVVRISLAYSASE